MNEPKLPSEFDVLTEYLVRAASAATSLQSIHLTGQIEGVDVEEAKRVLAECVRGITEMFTKHHNESLNRMRV